MANEDFGTAVITITSDAKRFEGDLKKTVTKAAETAGKGFSDTLEKETAKGGSKAGTAAGKAVETGAKPAASSAGTAAGTSFADRLKAVVGKGASAAGAAAGKAVGSGAKGSAGAGGGAAGASFSERLGKALQKGAAASARAWGKAFSGKASPEAEKAAEAAGKKFRGKMGSVLKKGAIATGAAVAGVLAVSLTKGLQRLTAIDDAKAKLTGLGSSAAEVEKIMGNALASVKGTAYGLGDAAGIAGQLVASGIKPGKELEAQLKLVADTASITGRDLGNIGTIWAKVAAKGKLDGQSVNQLLYAGIPILDLLAKQYGVSAAAASKMVSEGKVDFDSFSEAMEKKIGGAAKDSGKTFRGAMANVGAALGRLGANVLSGVFSQMPKVFGDINAGLDSLSDGSKKVGEWLGKAFAKAYAAGKQYLPVVKQVAAAIGGLFALVVGGKFTSGLRKSLGIEEDSKIVDTILNIRDKILSVFDAIKGASGGTLVSGLIGAGGALTLLANKFGLLKPFVKGFLGPDLIKNVKLFGSVLKSIGGPWLIVIGLFATAYTQSEDFRTAINNLLVTLGKVATELLSTLLPVFMDLADAVLPALVKVVEALTPALILVVNAIAAMAPFLGKMAPYILAIVVAWKAWNIAVAVFNVLSKASTFGLIVAAVAAVAAGIYYLATKTQFFQTIWKAVWGFVEKVVGKVVGWWQRSVVPAFTGGMEKVGSVFSTIGDAISAAFDWVKGVATTALDAIVGAFNWLKDTASSVWGSVTGAISTAWGVVQPILAAIGNWIGKVLVGYFNFWWGVVTRVFAAVRILATALWKGLQWVFEQAKTGLGLLGQAFVWLYNKAVKPVFGWVAALAKWLWAGLQGSFKSMQTGLTVLGSWFVWLYQKAVLPIWQAIQRASATAWAALQRIFGYLKAGLAYVGDKFVWLYRNAVLPTMGWISSKIATTWTGLQRIFGYLKQGLGWVGDKFTALWNKVKSVMGWVGDKVKAVWTGSVKWAFDAMKTGLDLLGKAFDKTKKFIGRVWDGVKALVKAPIRFVIETVLNNGIIGGFNKLARFVKAPEIDRIPLPKGFATGGVLPGYTPGRDVHTFTSPTGGTLGLSGGEAVMRPEWTRAIGGPAEVARQNRAARLGKFASGGVIGNPGPQSLTAAFGTGGGLMDWIKDKGAGAFKWLKDKASAAYQFVKNPLAAIKSLGTKMLSGIPGGQNMLDLGKGVVGKAAGGVASWVKEKISAFKSAFGKVEAEKAAASGPSGFGPQFVGTGAGSGWPVRGPITAGFGRYPSGGAHRGIDIGVPTGTLVHAFRSGLVNFAGWDNTGFGNLVRLSHGNGLMSYYGHNQKVLVKTGQQVAAGTGIAISDSTGNSSGPHVHFEVQQNGRSVNPYPYLNGKGAARGGGSSSGSWALGGVMDPFVADAGVTLGRGLNLLNNKTGGPEPLRRVDHEGGGDVYIENLTISVDDLKKMSEVGDFIDMLKGARVQARRTANSGMVSA